MRILSLLLVFAMLFSFAACGTDPAPADTTDGAADTTPAETTPEETTTELTDNLPDVNYEDRDFVIWIDAPSDESTIYDVDAESVIEGDVMSEAAVERNNTVQDRFGVKLVWDIGDTVSWRGSGNLRTSIQAGDPYDIVQGVSLYHTSLSNLGCLINLSNQQYIDLEKPWWFKYVNETYEIGDRQYLASGFFEFPTIYRSTVWFFNQLMVKDYNLGNIYELVEKDQWTLDKVIEMAEIVSDDVNQDGVMNEQDVYGISSGWDTWGMQVNTAGYQYATVNDDGTFTVTGLTDQLLEMHAKIYPLASAQRSDIYWSIYTKGVHPKADGARGTQQRQMFANNQILFLLDGIGQTGDAIMRDFGEYGIMPSPKYVEGQTMYGSSTSAFVSGVPVTCEDYEAAAIVLEGFEVASYDTMRPAYYGTALAYKYVNDEESVEMIDLALSNVCCEITYNYASAASGMDTNLCMAISTQENLASFFDANKERYNTALNTIIQQIQTLPDM